MTPHIGWPAAWSHDGKAIFSYHDSGANRIPLVIRDLETGHERELYSLTFDSSNYYTSGLALSNDGQQLAFSVFKSGSKIIKVVPAAGGEVRDLLRGDESLMPIAFGSGTVAWAPDNRNILFIRPTTNGSSKRELWMIPLQGGEA